MAFTPDSDNHQVAKFSHSRSPSIYRDQIDDHTQLPNVLIPAPLRTHNNLLASLRSRGIMVEVRL
jgi:hypothetical protein